MGFDVAAARKEGYSDSEIADYLAGQNKFNISGARNEGYSDEEIIGHLATQKHGLIDRAKGLIGNAIDAVKPAAPKSVMDGYENAQPSNDSGVQAGANGRITTVSDRAMDIGVNRAIAPKGDEQDAMAEASKFLQGSNSPRIADQEAVTRKPERMLADAEYAAEMAAPSVPMKEYGPGRSVGSDLYEIGRQLVGGAVTRAPGMVGSALEWWSQEGTYGEHLGKIAKDYWKEKEKDWTPDLKDRGIVASTLIEGAAQTAPSVMGMAAAAINPLVGAIGISALFGGQQAQETYDKGIAAGLKPEQARLAAYQTGLIEGFGETVADVTGAKLLTGAGKAIWGAAKGGVEGAAKAAISPEWAMRFAKDWMANAVIQSATEYGQGYGEAAVEKAYGIDKQSPHEAGVEGARVALGMSALLGIPGAISHRNMAQNRAKIGVMLNDPAAPQELRIGAAKFVADDIAGQVGKEKAMQWFGQMSNAITGKVEQPAQTPADILASPTTDAAIQNFTASVSGDAALPSAADLLGEEIAQGAGLITQDAPASKPEPGFVNHGNITAPFRGAPSQTLPEATNGTSPDSLSARLDSGSAAGADATGSDATGIPGLDGGTPAVPGSGGAGISTEADAGNGQNQPVPDAGNGAVGKSSLGFKEAFDSLKGGGFSSDFYGKAFAALQQGKSTISGVKDPILMRAKAAFDDGLIQSPADIRKFEKEGYPTLQPTKEPSNAQTPQAEPSQAQQPAQESAQVAHQPAISTELPQKTELNDNSEAIKPLIQELTNLKKTVDEIKHSTGISVKVFTALIEKAKDGSGKASDFAKMARRFKGKDERIHAALSNLANAIEQTKPAAPKQQKAAQSLIARIRQLGGINLSFLRDITGESDLRKSGAVGVFSNNGRGLDDLATMLADEGFPINLADESDNGGVNQLSELIREALGGSEVLTYSAREAKLATEQEAEHKGEVRKQAKALGVKTVGRKFSDIEAEVIKLLEGKQAREEGAVTDAEYEALDERVMYLQDRIGEEGVSAIYSELSKEYGDKSARAFHEALSKRIEGAIHEYETRSAGEVQQAVAGKPGEGNAAGSITAGAGGNEEAHRQAPILESYTKDEVIQRERAQAVQEAATRSNEAQARKDQAAKDKADLEARTKAHAENPDNFQFGESSKDAVKPMGDIFAQPDQRLIPVSKRAQQFVPSPEGSIDFGEITLDMAEVMRRQAGKVRLEVGNSDYGLTHIEQRHGAQIRGMGFKSVVEFVSDAVKHIESIWSPHKTSQMVMIQAHEKGKAVFIQLKPSESGDFYTVNTAFPVSEGYAEQKKWKMLWSGVSVPTVASGATSFADPARKAGEQVAMTSSQSSDETVRQPATESKPSDTRFANNKLFTADKVAEARARMKKKLGTLNSGIDPEFMQDGITLAGAHIEAGARAFAAYSKAMIEDLGEAIKPYLRSFYEGVRHYPGLTNEGMTSAADLDTAEKEAKQQPHESTSPAIGKIEPKPKRDTTPKIKRAQGDKLKDDYGISSINGYDNETGEGASGPVKREFLKDAKRYLDAVATELAGRGFAPYSDRKGKPGKAVSVNESGIVTSGDITLTMLHESGKGIYIHIGGTSLRGMIPVTKSGISVMMRVTKNSDRFGGEQNRWMPVNLSAGELADAAENAVAEAVKAGAAAQQKIDSALAAGKAAFEAGKTRNVPIEYVADKEAARLWAQGWDAANLAAPIDNANGKAQDENRGADNAEPLQTERIPGSDTQADNGRGTSGLGNRAGEPLDAGLAGTGEGADRSEPVSGGIRGATGTSDRGRAEPGLSAHGELGEAGVPRNDGGMPDAGLDHTITDADEIGSGGLTKKFRDNVAAIKILKALDAENRSASPEERKTLARYVGFGALKGVFDRENKQWAKQYAELKELLTPEEYDSARASVLNAHYTAKDVVDRMYQAVDRMGFTGGRILEPSVGSGNFFGMMPAGLRKNSRLHGVELDSLTSKLAKALYPKANIAVATGFQEYQVPSGYFDMAIGNPPFGSEPIVDKERSEYSGFSIHNYFIARMIDKVRDGGIVPVIVSHNFMDAINPKAREWIAKRANLLGAVRLPETAFKANAGTEVVTDILFFQKTATPEKAPAWLNSSDMEITNPKSGESATASVNDYFQQNKQNVLGKETAAGTMYRGDSYTVESNGALGPQLEAFIKRLPANIYTPIERPSEELDSADNTIPDGVKQGSYYIADDGAIRQRANDVAGMKRSISWVPKNETAAARMRGMIGLRSMLRAQMRMERDAAFDEKTIERHRKELNKAYDEFHKKYGFVNSQVNRALFLDDTEAALLQSIEFDYDKGVSKAVAERNDMDERAPSAKKADILQRRVLFPNVEKMNVETAKDALLASLDEKGRIDLDYMERAYRKPQKEIVQELGDLIYQDPASGDHVMADEYLSGDVKTKLAEARKAAEGDHAYQRNVAALEKVIPADKLPSEIFASIGAGWIPAETFQQFGTEITGSTNIDLAYVAATAQWMGNIRDGGDIGKMRSDFGTDKLSAFDLFKLMLNGRAPEIKKRIMRDGKETYVTDEEATEAAREKVNKIKSTWESWVWADGARAEKLAAIFNEKHNRTVNRQYDGSHLVLHGMTPALTMRAHQKSGIWRMVQERNALLDHVVGAGKTFAMTGAAMEFRRLGIARKPLFVVPNHLTMQWRTEFAKMYPAANVLAATPDDFSKGNRERMFSKIALGDYDAVIIGHSSLTKIGLDPTIEQEMVNEQIKEIADAIEDMKRERGDRSIVRDMEKIKANLEAKVADLVAKAGQKDKVVTFDELGVDALFVDEMHEFKNLFFVTQKQRVSGLGNPKGSGKAFDLFAKVRWMQKTFGENAPLITATGTPVSNSLAEMFTMQRYMRYDELKRDGLHLFDAWARMYGEDEYVYEVAPSGVGYRISQRFSKFKNLPALMAHYRSFADTVTLQDLKDQAAAEGNRFPVPKMVGGKPQNVVAQRSDAQRDFFGIPKVRKDEQGNIVYGIDPAKAKIEQNNDGAWILSDGHSSSTHQTREDAELELVEKALTPVLDLDPKSLLGQFANLKELTRKTKGKINALSLTSLASKAGLDMRMIYPGAPDFPDSKINKAVANMLRIYKQWSKDKGAQLVFCDLSVPASARAAMASNERRLYVLDDKGLLTHKKGTLQTVEEFEGFPFYLVRTGKGESAAVTIYDPVTGARIKSDLPNKAEAKAWVADFLSKDDNRDKWYEMRETRAPITAEQIAEYRDANDLELAEDGSNEVSMEDLDAVAGSSQFSVYDDIKAKLIAQGVPEKEIAFIHDFDTPAKKQELFKRVNRGDVRFLFGSTPKLGAGTNVQERLVGLHHIDAPWRPSDLEQREGRIIRQGNKLYERDPEGFEVFVGRYATEQTYDTRRWQLLEHKAAGIEQLRKYSGEIEIEDVAGEAANAADMKAAASGNPLILEETQLRTEVKRLSALQRGHADSTYALQRKLSHERNRVSTFLPRQIAAVNEAIAAAKANPARHGKDEIGSIVVDGKNIKSRAAAEDAIAVAAKRVQGSIGRSVKEISYRGVLFELDGGGLDVPMTLHAPTGQIGSYSPRDAVSPSGMITRFENYIEGLGERKARIAAEIAQAQADVDSIEARIHAPFAEAGELEIAKQEHARVQRKLMKSTQIDAVAPEERAAFNEEIDDRKRTLESLGYGHALREMDSDGATVFSLSPDSDIADAAAVIDVGTAQRIVDRFVAEFAGASNIKVVPDFAALPHDIQDDARAQGGNAKNTKGALHHKTGTVYIVAGNHSSEADVQETIFHEMLGHIGIRTLLGQDFVGKLNTLFVQLGGVKGLSNIAESRGFGSEFGDYVRGVAEARGQNEKFTLAIAKAVLTEEVFAHAAEQKPKLLDRLKALIGMLRESLRNMGLMKLADYGETDLLWMLHNAEVKLQSGKADGRGGWSVFSKRQTDIPGTEQPPAQPPRQNNLGLQGGWQGNNASWDAPEPSALDNLTYKLQNKHIDLKRVVEAIKSTGAELGERWNTYLQEELFHGRAAKRTQDFVNTELKPLIDYMRMAGLTLDELDHYLHARHAEEANALIAERDSNMPDGGSGMTNQQAEDYFANLPDAKKKQLDAAAKRVDAIIAKTRDLYVAYGLVSKNQADEWAAMFQHYVPLMREDHDGGMGIGQGFSIKGKEVKHRTGSTAAVVDIFANIALQREKAITRGEKNRVAVSLAGLAKLNPNSEFWTFGKVPTERVLNEQTGLVEERADPMFKSRDNVVVAKIKDNNGEIQERAVVFNEHNERAVRMAEAIKNLDATQLGELLATTARITRYFSSINTQYNPVFGVTNLVRDTQGLLLNLSSTPIAQHRAEVLKNIPSALKGIYADTRAERKGRPATSEWAQLWEELQNEGGMTGYRDLYRNSEDRAKAIEHELDPHNWVNSKWGKVFTAGGMLKVPMTKSQDMAAPIFDWLSDYNLTMEGATRLSAYKVAIEQGMSKREAASLAKNITVNFNRKGQIGQQAGALYAFFNAAMQGTARIGETLFTMDKGDIKTLRLSKSGKAIVAGGVMLGVMQALALAAAGFDDDEPPEFLRERSLIIPIGGKKYVSIPMPLGFHAIPNVGRIATEWAMHGFKHPADHATRLISVFADAFNPIGSSGISIQTIAPTALDPFAALAENKDWTGKPIAKEDFNSMNPTPGFTRNKDTATKFSKLIAEAINTLTGGTKYTPGMASPTADQIDYLFGQVTGGVGRELGKLEQTAVSTVTGDELPTYKIPLVGRFYGDSETQSSQANAFYTNLKKINEVAAEIKGRMKDRQPTNEYRAENPEYQLIMRANYAEKIVSGLRKQKREMIEKDAPRERIKAIEDRITNEMRRLNDAVRMLREKKAA